MTSKYLCTIATLGLSLVLTTPCLAAIEIDENDFGPSYDTMVVDSLVGKPLQLISALAGTATFIVSLPFSTVAGNANEAQQTLVTEPWESLQRCLGCTVAEDNFYKSQVVNDNQVRLIIDQPSEIIINTDDHVVIVPQ